VITVADPAYPAQMDHGDPELWRIVQLDDGQEVCTPLVCDFPDSALRTAVEFEVHYPAPFEPSDLAQIKHLVVSSAVLDLSGVQFLANLQHLLLYHSKVTDLRPLASPNNTRLKMLYFRDHKITDISPLVDIPSLWSLTFRCGPLSDISPLAAMTNLGYVSLPANQLTNVSPLLAVFPDNGRPDRSVDVSNNPATVSPIDAATRAVIDELVARGVTVYH
jgi:hypothetical protein